MRTVNASHRSVQVIMILKFYYKLPGLGCGTYFPCHNTAHILVTNVVCNLYLYREYSRASKHRTLWEQAFCPLFGGCPYLGGLPHFVSLHYNVT